MNASYKTSHFHINKYIQGRGEILSILTIYFQGHFYLYQSIILIGNTNVLFIILLFSRSIKIIQIHVYLYTLYSRIIHTNTLFVLESLIYTYTYIQYNDSECVYIYMYVQYNDSRTKIICIHNIKHIQYNNSTTKIINPISNIQSKVAWYRDVICVAISNKAL